MGYVTVKFIGDEFQISEAVNQYLDYQKVFSPITKKLLDVETANMNRDSLFEPSSAVERSTDYLSQYKKAMKDAADYLVEQLFKQDIYNVTADELLNNYEYYSTLEKFTVSIVNKCFEEGQNFLAMKQSGMANAYRYSSSQITGSGVGFITNSLSSLAVHSAVEFSILMSQAKKADEQYQTAVKKINSKVNDGFEKMCRDVIFNQYYPGVTAILMQFVNDITSAFFAQLTVHGKFDFDSISEYNMLKADEMLKNIDKVTNKNDFLKQVFLQCPFNPSVYEKCLDLGLLDVETFKTAEYFNLTNEFSDKIEKQCKKCIDEKENFSSAIELYMYYKKINKKEALAELYKDQISYIKYQYQSISKALLSDFDLKSWIQPNITTSVTTLCEYDEFKLNQRINDVLSKIISNNQYDMFKRNGLLNTFNIPNYSEDKLLSDINSEICSQLVLAVTQYIEKVKQHRTQCLEEYHIIKQQYDENKALYDKQINELDNELNSLTTERNSTGFFAFSKKKDLDLKIEQARQNINKLKSSNELSDLKNKCDIKLRQADDFV